MKSSVCVTEHFEIVDCIAKAGFSMVRQEEKYLVCDALGLSNKITLVYWKSVLLSNFVPLF